MDERQFYDEADQENGACFRMMLGAWKKAGGTLKWGAGGVGLRGKVNGKDVGFCFVAPAFKGKKDRIELGCAQLKKQLGESQCSRLVESLRRAAGDSVKGQSMISIPNPGELPASKQKALMKTFTDLV
jgi:hypothetical protein